MQLRSAARLRPARPLLTTPQSMPAAAQVAPESHATTPAGHVQGVAGAA